MKHLRFAALMASAFSIFFAFSIVKQVSAELDQLSLFLVTLFLFFVLVINEYFKVSELSKRFNKDKHNVPVIIFTFTLSLFLSSVGIHYSINNTNFRENDTISNYTETLLEVEQKYSLKADSITNLSYGSEFESVNESLDYWKNRVCRTFEERDLARKNVIDLENRRAEIINRRSDLTNQKLLQLNELKKLETSLISHNKNVNLQDINKNNFLFLIIFALVLIVEFMIIYIQYCIANFFNDEQKRNLLILKNLLLREKKNIELDDIRFSSYLSNVDDPRTEANNFRFLLGNLGIISKKPEESGKIMNESGYSKLKNYYIQTNKQV